MNGNGAQAVDDEVKARVPVPRARNSGKTACVTLSGPKKLTVNMFWIYDSEASSQVPMLDIPALLKTMSMCPKMVQAWLIFEKIASRGEDMSSSRNFRDSEFESVLREARRSATFRPVAMTLSPRERISCTTDLPIPEVVPVTSLFFKD